MPRPPRTYGWYILGLLALLNFLNYANRNVVFSMYDDLRSAFGFSNAELGLLGTAFMLTHALVTMPIAWLGDYIDRRRLMAVGLFVWSAAALASAVATGIGSMLVARAIVGIGTAACVPVANALLCDVFDPRRKARVVSIFNLGLFLGGLAGFFLGLKLGFPWGFVAVGAPGFVLVLLVGTLRIDEGSRQQPLSRELSFFADAAAILRVPPMRWTIFGAVAMAFAAGGYLSWFLEFLLKVKMLGETEAYIVFSVALSGGLFGVLVGGIVGDRLSHRFTCGRQLTLALGFAAAVPCALAAIYWPTGAPFYAISWGLMFFASWYHGPLAASVDDLAPENNAAAAQGFYIAVMHLFGTAPASYVVGLLADHAGLQTAMLAPTAAMVVAALAFLLSARGVARSSVVKGREA